MDLFIAAIIGAVAGSMYRMSKKNKDEQNLRVTQKVTNTPVTTNATSALNTRVDLNEQNLPTMVKQVCSVIEDKLRGKDLSAYHQNIKTFRFTSYIPMRGDNAAKKKGVYESLYYNLDNLIYLSKNCTYLSLCHELLHLCTNRVINGVAYCGFAQITKRNVVGYGFNEGYTELLTDRYFNENHLYRTTYPKEVAFAKVIENLVGRYRMEDLYFKSDLNGLVTQLNNYYRKEDILKFISSIDIIGKACLEDGYKMNRKNLDNALVYACNFAYDATDKKIKMSQGNDDVLCRSRILIKNALKEALSLTVKDSPTYDYINEMLKRTDIDYPRERAHVKRKQF